MKKNTVKKIFIFFMVFLPVQYALVGVIGVVASEPWPALVLPAFQNVDTTPAYVSVLKPIITAINYDDNSNDSIKPSEIFTGIHESQLQGFLRTHLGNSLKWSKKGEVSHRWLYNQLRTIYPATKLKKLNVKWQKNYYNFSASNLRIDSTQIVEDFSVSFYDAQH